MKIIANFQPKKPRDIEDDLKEGDYVSILLARGHAENTLIGVRIEIISKKKV